MNMLRMNSMIRINTIDKSECAPYIIRAAAAFIAAVIVDAVSVLYMCHHHHHQHQHHRHRYRLRRCRCRHHWASFLRLWHTQRYIVAKCVCVCETHIVQIYMYTCIHNTLCKSAHAGWLVAAYFGGPRLRYSCSKAKRKTRTERKRSQTRVDRRADNAAPCHSPKRARACCTHTHT